MTREEAIEKLNNAKGCPLLYDSHIEALDMAISALEQEACDDAIDREYLFKVLDDFCGHDRTATITLDTLADLVYDMPPVTQKSGKWHRKYDRIVNDLFWECDKCGCGYQHEYNFCPNCGAKMESEDKE